MKIQKRGRRWVTTIYNPATRGKVWVSGASREECKANAGVALARLQRAQETPETVEAFAKTWVDVEGPFSRRRLPQTLKHNEERLSAFRKDFGHRRLASITASEALAWSHANIGRFPVVRTMFADAKRLGLVDENPFIDLRLGSQVKDGPINAPTPKDIEALCVAAAKVNGEYGRKVFANLIRVAAFAGLRPGELYGLEWADVDLKAGELHVRRQFNQALGRLSPPKYESYRTVALLDGAVRGLEALPRATTRPPGIVAFTPTGVRFTGSVVGHYWHPVRNLVGHPEWVFRSLRHHYGTYLASLGMGPYEIAKAMGHKDNGETAMRHYIRMAERDVNDRIRQAERRGRFQVIEGEGRDARR